MAIPTEYPFDRYLAAKKPVDDRALNAHVFQTLRRHLEPPTDHPLRVLEVGAGVGTMIVRLLERGLHHPLEYTAIDEQPANVAALPSYLAAWAEARGGRLTLATDGAGAADTARILDLQVAGARARVYAEAADLFDYAERADLALPKFDLLIANAVLDLVDARAALAALLPLLAPGALLYLTITFDGITILEPAVDPALDELLPALYARSIDQPRHEAKPPGDSRAGRHLFGHLRALDLDVLAAGSSDWVVFAGPNGYPGDEAFFLHWLVHQFGLALRDHPQVPTAPLEAWTAARHAQIEASELVYTAHQMDYLAISK